MATIDINELGTRTSEVIRRVLENGETIYVTEGGSVVARVVPVKPVQPEVPSEDREAKREATRAWLRDVDEFAHKVARDWPRGVSAQDVIDDVRRERW